MIKDEFPEVARAMEDEYLGMSLPPPQTLAREEEKKW